MALWSGRFEEAPDAFAHRFGASLETDKAMALQDIAGSIAHARMLAAQGIISDQDAEAIEDGLGAIRIEIKEGTFAWDAADEDVHMAIERVLTERIGDAGARLHTGRSRNDQVATDIRLLAKELSGQLMEASVSLRKALVAAAEQNTNVVLPGYTHLQHAQPVSFAHHLLAYYWMLTRDFTRFKFARFAADASPLGAAALAGTTYPLDRQKTANELGFSSVMPNSLDAVSDRDYLLDLEYACSVCAMHLSRFAEEIVLWSSTEFGFITLSDAWSTGSSIMPQKKNPDFAELVRGKTGRVVGSLVSLLVTMKGLPLAYNKDLQECKEGALDAAGTLSDCLRVVEGMVSTWQVNADAMATQASTGFTAATDVADYLAKKGLPFRSAHEVVGKLVLDCERRGVGLEDLSLEDFQAASPLFESDIVGALDPVSIAAARNTEGGTGSVALADQLVLAREVLGKDEAQL